MQRIDQLFLDVVSRVAPAAAERGQIGKQARRTHERDILDSLGALENAGVDCPEGNSATLVDLAQTGLLDRVAERRGKGGVRDVDMQVGRGGGEGGGELEAGPAADSPTHRSLQRGGEVVAQERHDVFGRAMGDAGRATKDVMALLRNDLAPALERTVGWAVSGWAGLELAAPFATTTPNLHIYVADTAFAAPLSDAIEEAGLREIDEGGRITFWAVDARVFKCSQRIEDVPLVSAPRLFADLSSFGGRGGDAADHVKEELIDPLHRGEPTEGDSTVNVSTPTRSSPRSMRC